MHAITKEKLRINARNAWRMWSNWVVTATSVGGAAYFALPLEEQRQLLSHLPLVPPWTIPILAGAIAVGARVWPQHSLSPDVAAAKSADAPQAGAERQE